MKPKSEYKGLCRLLKISFSSEWEWETTGQFWAEEGHYLTNFKRITLTRLWINMPLRGARWKKDQLGSFQYNLCEE